MITPLPKKAGNSFKGVVQYITHDKGADTAHRVAFIETKNLLTNDPQKAARCMAWTAMHQRELKQQANKSATGRKSEGSVYHYTLNWDNDDRATQAEMVKAAHDTLEVLGLKDHEAVLAGHNDTDHTHVHVVVNLIHPDTGMKARLGMSKRKMSEWALAYESERGRIVCPDRIANRNTRSMMRDHKKSTGQYPVNLKWPKGQTREDYHRWKKQQWQIQKLLDRAEREFKWKDQEKARKIISDEMKKRMKVARTEAKEFMRPHWRDHYKQQEQERRKFAENQKFLINRAIHFMKNRRNDLINNQGFLTGLWESLVSGERNWDAMNARQAQTTVAMRQWSNKASEERTQPIYDAFTAELKRVRERQRQEREEQKKVQFERNKQKINVDTWKRQQNSPTEAFKRTQDDKQAKEAKELRELEAVFGDAAKAMMVKKKENAQAPQQGRSRNEGRVRKRTRPRNPSS